MKVLRNTFSYLLTLVMCFSLVTPVLAESVDNSSQPKEQQAQVRNNSKESTITLEKSNKSFEEKNNKENNAEQELEIGNTLTNLQSVQQARAPAGKVNTPGDTVNKVTLGRKLDGTFTWTSIPGYRHSSNYYFTLYDKEGGTHEAFCIDSARPDPSKTSKVSTYTGSMGGITAAALYALHKNQFSGGTISFSVSTNDHPVNLPGRYKISADTGTFSGSYTASDIGIGLAWLAWRRGNTALTQDVVDDMSNVMKDLIPDIYLSRVTVRCSSSKLSGKELKNIVAGDVDSMEHLSVYKNSITFQKTTPQITPMRGIGSYTMHSGKDDEYDVSVSVENLPLTKNNYKSYEGRHPVAIGVYKERFIYPMVRRAIGIIVSTANAQSGAVGYIWDKFDGTQRLLTFDYVLQEAFLKMHKRSANPSITDGNNCYTFEGIKYELYDSSRSKVLGTFTLDKNGDSNEIRVADAYTRSTLYIREVNDQARINSGYAYDPQFHKFSTLVDRQQEEVVVKDIPLVDPVGIELRKLSDQTKSDTTRSYINETE